jgi:GntR family transcriptional regulator
MNEAFAISQADKRPMYLQIIEQIKERIAVGDWAPGQAIPSIRQLAADLQVSVITVKRAYLELEREGVIVTQQGKGSHVASSPGLGARLREQELAQHLEQVMRIAAQLGIRQPELEERLREAGDRVAEKETI